MTELGIKAAAQYRTVDETSIVEMLLLAGWSHERRSGECSAATHAATDALDRWISLGLPFERSLNGGRRFDPAEVMNFGKWICLRNRDSNWGDRFVANARRLVREFHAEGTQGMPPPPSELRPARFSVSLQREYDLRDREPGTNLRLRLPLPLEDQSLEGLSVTTVPPPDQPVEFTVAPGRLDARLRVPPSRTVSLGMRVTFTALPTVPSASATPLPPEEVELYTRPREGLISVSPRIQVLATDLAGSTGDPWEAVRQFWDFLSERLIGGVIHYDELPSQNPTDWVLDTGWFDCQLGSAILAALCRARGIPARMVSGYTLYRACPFYHYWLEAWVEGRGWIPIDPMGADLTVRGEAEAWRNYFFGCLDYRMKTQCLPRLFDGTAAIRFPARWHFRVRSEGEGVEAGFFATDTGAPIYRDRISVLRGKSPPPLAITNAVPL